ncbi:radical SAM/SPASM domain-containing protein [Clostridium cuniculi]|uniref:radical SAM/SPASM domain-containing protein n=1 Tax=Clostridium cuniculi TaxID=2548455 RepID=UPI001056ADA2|nr:radical SAM protein [Clostridium cuniculi]
MKKSKYNIEILGKKDVAIYNLLNRSIILLDKDIYNSYLINTLEDEEIKYLSEIGILIEDGIDEVEVMKQKINSAKYSPKAMTIFLSLTQKCNLKCIYCYQDSIREKNIGNYIDEKNIEKIFLMLKKKSSEMRSLNIVLFGGEPLLNKEKILSIISNLNELRTESLKVHISLITNGVELTQEFLNSTNKYLNTIQITIDGKKEIHDSMRIFPNGDGSFDIIYQNLKKASKLFKGRVALRINVNKNSISHVYDFIEQLEKDNLMEYISISIVPIFDNQTTISLGCNKGIEKEILEEVNNIYMYLAKKKFKFEKDFVEGPCMVRHFNSFAVDEELNIYECPGVLYNKSSGKITNTGDLKILDSRFYKFVNEEKKCINTCEYAPICFGGCSWQNRCNKNELSMTLIPQLKAYLVSRYNFEL